MTTILTGKFPASNGSLATHDRTPVEATRDGQSVHFRVTASGHGSVPMTNGSGLGSFFALDGREFGFSLEPEGTGTRYRIYEGATQIATGTLHDLPP